jgi:hypothetical protein
VDDPSTGQGDELVPVNGWPPARGPHLPDALGILPGPAWIFVLLAVGRLVWALRDASPGPVLDPLLEGRAVLYAIPSVTIILLPAALLIRHPDAPSRGRTLFVGTVLLAVVEGMRLLNILLGPVFEQLTPADAETIFLVPLDLVFKLVVGIMGLYGLASVALGLSQARRYADRSGTSLIVGVLGLLAVLGALALVVLLAQHPVAQSVTPIVILYYAVTAGVYLLSTAAWWYLAATLARGARAGDEPRAGWSIGAAGAALVLVGRALAIVINLARPTPESQPVYTNLLLIVAVISALGYLGLLGGFALGMPAPDQHDNEGVVTGDA